MANHLCHAAAVRPDRRNPCNHAFQNRKAQCLRLRCNHRNIKRRLYFFHILQKACKRHLLADAKRRRLLFQLLAQTAVPDDVKPHILPLFQKPFRAKQKGFMILHFLQTRDHADRLLPCLAAKGGKQCRLFLCARNGNPLNAVINHRDFLRLCAACNRASAYRLADRNDFITEHRIDFSAENLLCQSARRALHAVLCIEDIRHSRPSCRHACRHARMRMHNIRSFRAENFRQRLECLPVERFVLHLLHRKHRHIQCLHRRHQKAVMRQNHLHRKFFSVMIFQIIQ